MSTNTVCWVDIPATNLERAIKFYSAVLGKEVVKQSQGGYEYGLLPHFESNVSGCVAVMQDSAPSQTGPLVYLNVEGRHDAAAKAVIENGGKILIEKHAIGPHGYRSVFVDSEGNRIALHSSQA